MTWMQTTKGRRFDLVNPDPALVDFEEVAEALGKLARFNGHTVGYPGYSVAQHCVLGAEGLYREGSRPKYYRRRMATLFLLHDAHEAFCGDLTTPVVAALEHIRWPDGPAVKSGSGLVGQLVSELKLRLDLAIYEAAGIDPPSHTERAVIKHWDARMMMAERNAFMGKTPEPWAAEVEPAPVSMPGIWHPQIAAREWLWEFEHYARAGK